MHEDYYLSCTPSKLHFLVSRSITIRQPVADHPQHAIDCKFWHVGQVLRRSIIDWHETLRWRVREHGLHIVVVPDVRLWRQSLRDELAGGIAEGVHHCEATVHIKLLIRGLK